MEGLYDCHFEYFGGQVYRERWNTIFRTTTRGSLITETLYYHQKHRCVVDSEVGKRVIDHYRIRIRVTLNEALRDIKVTFLGRQKVYLKKRIIGQENFVKYWVVSSLLVLDDGNKYMAKLIVIMVTIIIQKKRS